MTGSDLRRAMNLRSTWFRVGVLSLATPQAPVTYGKNVALSGVARRLPAVRLDQRQPGTSWEQVRPISPGPGGSVNVLGQAARADRLPARQRCGPQRDRARLRRPARPLPRDA